MNVDLDSNDDGIDDHALWQEGDDGFYYYKGTLSSNTTTVSFPDFTVNGTEDESLTLQIQVLAESIQSGPANAVADAWKMTYNGSAWAVVTP